MDRSPRPSRERLDAIPIRPTTARALHDGTAQPADLEVDPGLALARSRLLAAGQTAGPDWALDPLIDLPWWATLPTDAAVLAARQRLWRHALTVGLAARRLARQAPELGVDPDLALRAGLLQPLALWHLATTAPARLPRWLASVATEQRDATTDQASADLLRQGRRLADHWQVEPLVRDSVILGSDPPGRLQSCAHDPAGLMLIQRATALARLTPWSLNPSPTRDLGPTEPIILALMAEVQARTAGPLVASDATPREEALTRSHARQRRDLARVTAERDASQGLLRALAASPAQETPAAWSDRAAQVWQALTDTPTVQVALVDSAPNPAPARGASLALPLGDPARPTAWLSWDALPPPAANLPSPGSPVLRAWGAWGALVRDRDRLAERLDALLAEHRALLVRDDAQERQARLAALAEFAAGAGHELNNPLAVIMGRAQLLMARTTDPEGTRSLRAIITQVQRSHRILRDLMFIARPPEFRPRACQPDEIVRASLRDLHDEAEAQGVTLVADLQGPLTRIWADPDPLRHVADALMRNALEASSSGGTIRFTTASESGQVRWTVHDSGRGIPLTDGPHLFDPFFCGRQAGRGLGLGLPRAARIMSLLGGDIRWRSDPGRGTTFRVEWPALPIPVPAEGLSTPRPEGGQAERA